VVYNGKRKQSNAILRELMYKEKDHHESFWRKSDKIIYCPQNLENYVERNYGEIFVFPYKIPKYPARLIKEELIKRTLNPKRVELYLEKYNYLITVDEYF
jgi:hypothetical protein